MQKKILIDSKSFPTYLKEDIKFEGELKTSEKTLIAGSFEGTLNVDSALYALGSASLKKTISAHNCSIQGAHISGTVDIKRSLKIIKNSVVEGVINVADIEIESGAQINADIRMTQSPDTAKE